MKDVPKLRIYHQVTKHDPSIIVEASIAIEDSDSDGHDTPTPPQMDINPTATVMLPYNPTTTAIVPYNPITTTTTTIQHNTQPQRTFATFQRKPPPFVTAITKVEDKSAARMNLFNYMLTFRNRNIL